MNTSNGWIKLYRCLLDDPIWLCSTNEQKVILVTLLLMANHAERKWEWNGMPFQCQPGQMITSLNSIQAKCGKHVSQRNIRTALKRFEKFGFLTNQSTKHNRLITICNWSNYQNTLDLNDKQTDNPLTDDPPTHDSRLTPNKNVKNEKNIYINDSSYSKQRDSQGIDYNDEEALARWLAEEN